MREFWINVGRYAQYFVTVILGVVLTLMQPLRTLLGRPLTAVAVVGFLISAMLFLYFTLEAMLGLA